MNNDILKIFGNPTEFVYVSWQDTFSKFLWNLWTWRSQDIFHFFKNLHIFDSQIEQIFLFFSPYIQHIWEDKNDNRYKLYINLYDLTFEKSLNIIKHLKNILGEDRSYILQKNFLYFDCVGIDIYPNGNKYIKIYEIIKPMGISFEKNISVKEFWVLKDFSWRKKFFYRFSFPYPRISELDPNYNSNIFNSYEEQFKISLQRKIKYYCIEWDKKQFYCI